MAKQSNDTNLHQKYLKEYNKLAKKADRRMRELERFSRYKEYEDIKEYAYKVAKQAIQKYTPPGMEERAPRWQRNEPMDTRTLKAKIADIKHFLDLKTSTVTGVRSVYMNRAKSLNKVATEKGKPSPNFTWQELANFFESGIWDKNKDKYGSATLLVSIGTMKLNHKKIADRIKSKSKDYLVISNEDVVNETINNLLSEQGKDVKKLLSKNVI